MSESPYVREDPLTWTNLLRAAVFVCVATLFAYDHLLVAIRLLGLQTLVESIFLFINPRIPYGWVGRPPSGYLSGALAKWLATVFGVLGVILLFFPAIGLVFFR